MVLLCGTGPVLAAEAFDTPPAEPPGSAAVAPVADEAAVPLPGSEPLTDNSATDTQPAENLLAATNDMWSLCGPVAYPESPAIDPDDPVTRLTADWSESRGDIHTLGGDILVTRNEQWLRAGYASYDATSGIVTAWDNVSLGTLDLSTSGTDARLDLDRNAGEVSHASFNLRSRHARGTADRIILENRDVTRLKRARYTTCNPGQDDWYLNSGNVKLDQQSGFGTATNVYVTFFHVPILYLPYITFPINDQRKTGFLVPGYANSSSSGEEIWAPYYINLAPNYDATVTPRVMRKRGTQLQTEFRYLGPGLLGTINLEYLNDREYAFQKAYAGTPIDDNTRTYARIDQTASPAPGWNANLKLQHVSDEDYFDDLGNDLESTTVTHMEQLFDLTYQRERTTGRFRIQGFKTLDETISPLRRPYRRLPQIEFTTTQPWQDSPAELGFDGEFVSFDHAVKLSGQRVDISPSLSYRYEQPYAFVMPKFTLRHTGYNLSPDPAFTDTNVSRSVPIYSVDSGLIFERNLNVGDTPYIQTLEPRLYMLYVPYEDQSHIPRFDTGLSRFGYDYMFRDNRFNGADRVGDTKQFTLAVTTRFLEDETGRERFQASIGQIFYSGVRQVGLAGNVTDDRAHSDIAGVAVGQLTEEWRVKAEMIRNDETRRIDKGAFTAQYRAANNRIFNASYRFDRAPTPMTEQTDVSFIWPVHRRWTAVGRWYYAHRVDVTLESIAGLEYNSCCWALRMVQRRYIQSTRDLEDANSVLMVQLELKGLAGIGNPIATTLTKSVPGFIEQAGTEGFQ